MMCSANLCTHWNSVGAQVAAHKSFRAWKCCGAELAQVDKMLRQTRILMT